MSAEQNQTPNNNNRNNNLNNPNSPDLTERPLAPILLSPSELKTLLVHVLETVTGLPPGRVIREGDGESDPRPNAGSVPNAGFAPNFGYPTDSVNTADATPAPFADFTPHPGLYCSINWRSMELLPQNNGDYFPVQYPSGGSAPEQAAPEGDAYNASPLQSANSTHPAYPISSDLNASEQTTSEPGVSDPSASDPNASAPNASDPGASAPNASDPSVPAPSASDPSAASDSSTSDSNASDMLQVLRNESWCEARISFWGPGAFEAAANAAFALQSDARRFDLWRLIGFGGVGPVEHTSAPFRGAVQGRAYFDLSFYACFGAAYPAEWFNTACWNLPRSGHNETFATSKEIACEPKSHCPILFGPVS